MAPDTTTRTLASPDFPATSMPSLQGPDEGMTLSNSVADPAFPFVTIAIPTFNRATFLRGCIASALAQTYPNFEVLVSNNASSDDTIGVLNSFNDARLRVVNQSTNIGLHPNLNACVTNAKGDYIVIVPDDDRITPWLLERCAGLIRQQPQLSTVVTLSDTHATGRTKPARTSRFHGTGIWDGTDILMDFLTDQITVTMCSIMMRTELVRERGGIPLNLPHTADVGTWAPLLFLGKAGFVNEVCATFTCHDESETARLGLEQLLQDGRKVADLIAQMADIHVADPQQRRSIQIHARRCFARRGLIALSDYRLSGGGVQALLDVMWHFRFDLYNVNPKSALRFIVAVLCPQSLATQLRQFRRGLA